MIMRELSDPRLPTIVSITRVKVSDDLEYADAYVSVMGTPGQQQAAINALKHSAGMMRAKLTKALSIRHAPYLRFHRDEQLQKELEVLTLIEKARAETQEWEAAQARKNAGTEASDQTTTENGGSGEPPPTNKTKSLSKLSLPTAHCPLSNEARYEPCRGPALPVQEALEGAQARSEAGL